MPVFAYLGGSSGVNLLESALAQPAQTFDGRPLYRTILDKAATLMCSLIKNHPFVDGNKRIAFTTVWVFLSLNGWLFYAPRKEAVERCLMIARTEGNVDWRETRRWLRPRAASIDRLLKMDTEELQEWLAIVAPALKQRRKLIKVLKQLA